MKRVEVAIVTGASSGIGKVTAELLACNGYRVFGTSRSEYSNARGSEMLVLDVRSEDSVQRCVDQVMERAGQIDVLINNAGSSLGGFVEETSIEQAKALFEVNFFGAVRMTKLVLPIMRKQNSGRIINVGSLAGLIGIPYQAFYVASKFALKGFTESLRLEVDRFHIKVSIIEPSFFKTNIANSIELGKYTPQEVYAPLREKVEKALRKEVELGEDPSEVARLILRVLRAKNPKLRYRIGKDAIWVPPLKSLLSDKIFSYALKKRLGLIS